MFKSTNVVTATMSAILVVALLLILPAISVGDDGADSEIARCALVNDASARLACFDKLGSRGKPTSAADAAPAAEPMQVAWPPDELGSKDFRRHVDKDESSVAARVIRCVKDTRKDYQFYLEGGQVWKQVDDRKLHYRTCEFNVTISRDAFGYKMQVEGEKSKYRVSRIQ